MFWISILLANIKMLKEMQKVKRLLELLALTIPYFFLNICCVELPLIELREMLIHRYPSNYADDFKLWYYLLLINYIKIYKEAYNLFNKCFYLLVIANRQYITENTVAMF